MGWSRDQPNLFGNSSNQSGGQGGGLGSMFGSGSIGGLGQLFEALFNKGGQPYKDASKEYNKYFQGAQGFQNPFMQAGQQGMGKYQDWLQGQQDPSAFINKLMGQYQESPFAHNQQQAAMRAGTNAASASGLSGSTPFAQQMQQNAGQIASGDQNQWLQSVLGINSQYGQGQQDMMQGGQHAADMLSQLFSQAGQDQSQLKYNQSRGDQMDWSKIFSGIGGLFGF